MGSIQKRSGKLGVSYRVQIRNPGGGTSLITKTFAKKSLATAWMAKTESDLAIGNYREDEQTFGSMIDRYTREIGAIKPFGRSKAYILGFLRGELGHLMVKELTAETLMAFALQRSSTCCAFSVKMDMQYIGVVLSTAENMWGAKPKFSEYRKCMDNCARLQIIAPSDERDRRVTDEELEDVLSYVQSVLPVRDWVAFSLATAMRVGEIGKLRWADLSKDGKSIIIRQRKHPRKKRDEVVPLVPEARDIISRQSIDPRNPSCIFPDNPKSITSAFRKGRERSGVEDLRYHDLRHEAISRLFELGLDSMVVATFSGHRDINMLRRYTHINAGKVLKMLDERAEALAA